MVDIGARASTWGYKLGLQSIIPSVLTLGLLGYPFVIVGPVGGVPANDFHRHLNRFMRPDQELYIRWVSFWFGTRFQARLKDQEILEEGGGAGPSS